MNDFHSAIQTLLVLVLLLLSRTFVLPFLLFIQKTESRVKTEDPARGGGLSGRRPNPTKTMDNLQRVTCKRFLPCRISNQEQKKAKREPTAPRIPTWSPTVVLTGPAVA